jgi:rhodanese-related sulfurtransferase
MNLGIGLSFQAGQWLPAYLLGVLLVILQLIVISAHFCVASWLFEGVAAILGRRHPRISSKEAHRLVEEDGAMLIDVRSPEEFTMGHLPGAVNIPVREIAKRGDVLWAKRQPLVLYCTAGLRCHKAAEILRRSGVGEVYELGPMKQWGNVAPSLS